MLSTNNKKRSHTQLDSRKQVIAFQDRVMTINIKEAQHPLKWEKQVIDKSSIMLKISTRSMHRVLVWEIGPANNTTRCSRLSKVFKDSKRSERICKALHSNTHNLQQCCLSWWRSHPLRTTWLFKMERTSNRLGKDGQQCWSSIAGILSGSISIAWD